MKNFKLLFGILISTIVLSCSSDDSGGGGGGDNQPNTKLPKKITMFYPTDTGQWSSFFDVYELFYNSDNTIDEIILKDSNGYTYSSKFSYENGFLHKSVYEEDYINFTRTTYTDYFYTNGKLVKAERLQTYSNSETEDSYTIEYFYTNGVLSSSSEGDGFTYEFSNGNLIKLSEDYGYTLYELIFTYDNKKNPFTNLPPNLKQVGIYLNSLEEMAFNSNNFINKNSKNITNNIEVTYNFIYVYDNDGFPIEIIEERSSEEQFFPLSKLIFEYYE